MYKYLLILLIITISTSYLLLKRGNAKTGTATYNDSHGVFAITYPEKWLCNKTCDGIVRFSPPGNASKDNSLTVVYGNLNPDTSLTLEEIIIQFKKSFKETYPFSEEIKPAKVLNLSGAKAVFYHFKTNTKSSKELFIILSINKGTIFIITASSPENKFSLYKENYLEMINNFQTPAQIAIEFKQLTPAYDNEITLKLLDFTESSKKFSIKYPEMWEINNMQKEKALSVGFSPTGEHPATNGILITIIKIASDQKSSVNLKTTATNLVNIYKKNLTGGEEIEKPQDFTLSQLPALKYHIKGEMKGVKLETLIIVSITETEVVIISASRPLEDFKDYEQVFMKMIESIQIRQSEKSISMNTLISPEDYFMLSYPSEWNLQKIDKNGKTAYYKLTSSEKDQDNNLIIKHIRMKEEQIKGITLDDIGNNLMENFKQNYSNFKELEKLSTISSQKFREYHFSGTINGQNWEGLAYIYMSGYDVYTIYGASLEKNFTVFKSIFSDMINKFYIMIPEKHEGWKIYNQKEGLFSFQYPSNWFLEEQTSDKFNYISISPLRDSSEKNGVDLLYFKIPDGQKPEDLDILLEYLWIQYEALGYDLFDKVNGKFSNFPSAILKVRKKADKNAFNLTVTVFMIDQYMIQIFQSTGQDEEVKNTCNTILNTFRPFEVKSEK